ncbi:hypothetical protein NQ315_005607 [Exocentrus adspersus]|uniref:Uncharacterized protein n=1 Tax=Exocentrus adspersus TaxID=1586481 RepID=A0AAV8VTF7_9CUCU|nr:hypothetical protein NQ315_005607 [Exocentrus adspersus]
MSPLVAGGPTSLTNSRQGGSIRSTPTPPPHGHATNNRGWSAICLRPTPPLRPCLALGSTPNGPYSRYSRKPMSYKEDGLILEVIEAYCSVTKPRSTVNSVNVTDGPKSDINKAIPEAINLLQSKLNILEYNVAALSSQISEEKEARCALQTIVKNYLTTNSKDFEDIPWPTMESNI